MCRAIGIGGCDVTRLDRRLTQRASVRCGKGICTSLLTWRGYLRSLRSTRLGASRSSYADALRYNDSSICMQYWDREEGLPMRRPCGDAPRNALTMLARHLLGRVLVLKSADLLLALRSAVLEFLHALKIALLHKEADRPLPFDVREFFPVGDARDGLPSADLPLPVELLRALKMPIALLRRAELTPLLLISTGPSLSILIDCPSTCMTLTSLSGLAGVASMASGAL